MIPARSTVAPVEVLVDGLSLRAAAASDQGAFRRDNQDAMAIAAVGGRVAAVLADGMGGQKGGGESAEAAVAAAIAALQEGRDVTEAMAAAAAAVGEVRARLGGQPGTTLIAALAGPDGVRLAHVGDCRAYLVAADGVVQLTEDHSWTAEEVRAGRMSAAAAANDNRRNLITRALIGDPVEPQVVAVADARSGHLLLCSDGVWDPLDDGQMAEICAGEGSVDQRVAWLVAAALDAGSRDNATAVVVDLP